MIIWRIQIFSSSSQKTIVYRVSEVLFSSPYPIKLYRKFLKNFLLSEQASLEVFHHLLRICIQMTKKEIYCIVRELIFEVGGLKPLRKFIEDALICFQSQALQNHYCTWKDLEQLIFCFVVATYDSDTPVTKELSKVYCRNYTVFLYQLFKGTKNKFSIVLLFRNDVYLKSIF